MKKRKLNVKLPFRRELGEEDRLFVYAVMMTDMDVVAPDRKVARWRMSKADCGAF